MCEPISSTTLLMSMLAGGAASAVASASTPKVDTSAMKADMQAAAATPEVNQADYSKDSGLAKKRLALAGNKSGTVLTSPLGLGSAASVQKKTLLGQ